MTKKKRQSYDNMDLKDLMDAYLDADNPRERHALVASFLNPRLQLQQTPLSSTPEAMEHAQKLLPVLIEDYLDADPKKKTAFLETILLLAEQGVPNSPDIEDLTLEKNYQDADRETYVNPRTKIAKIIAGDLAGVVTVVSGLTLLPAIVYDLSSCSNMTHSLANAALFAGSYTLGALVYKLDEVGRDRAISTRNAAIEALEQHRKNPNIGVR